MDEENFKGWKKTLLKSYNPTPTLNCVMVIFSLTGLNLTLIL